MRKFLGFLLLPLLLASCATPVPATRLEKANVLPLSLDDRYQFRKIMLYFNQGENQQAQNSQSEVVNFERLRMNFGAVDNYERNQRMGNYYTIFWRTSVRSDVTIRLEYRQAALANYVLAQERYYPDAKGSFKSTFSVNGDSYLENGRVTSWRVLLIVDGRIVALNQSYLWR